MSTLPCQSPKHPKVDHEDAEGPGGEVFEKQLRSHWRRLREHFIQSELSHGGKRRGEYSALLSHDH